MKIGDQCSRGDGDDSDELKGEKSAAILVLFLRPDGRRGGVARGSGRRGSGVRGVR